MSQTTSRCVCPPNNNPIGLLLSRTYLHPLFIQHPAPTWPVHRGAIVTASCELELDWSCLSDVIQTKCFIESGKGMSEQDYMFSVTWKTCKYGHSTSVLPGKHANTGTVLQCYLENMQIRAQCFSVTQKTCKYRHSTSVLPRRHDNTGTVLQCYPEDMQIQAQYFSVAQKT
jgi:hypothetical protein